MSLFGSRISGFIDDPFFSIHDKQLHRAERMMDNFMTPFDVIGSFGFPQLTDIPNPSRRTPHRNMTTMPFGFGRSIFPDVGEVISGVERMGNDPNCAMYSSSSVVSYSLGEDGKPKVYQASSSTRTAPGGVKETRRAMSDSTTGVRKLAIGHHLGERAHIVEKSQNGITGEEDDNEEYINIGDGEEERFNEEWCQRASRGTWKPHNRRSVGHHRPSVEKQQLAIAAGPSHDTARHGHKIDRNCREFEKRVASTEVNRTTNGNKQRHSGTKSKSHISML